MKDKQSPHILLGVFLAIGLCSSGYFISQTILNGKTAINTAEAKGLATRTVISDTVNWQLNFRVQGDQNSALTELYQKAEAHRDLIVQLLSSRGFSDNEIEIGVLAYRKEEFRDDKQQVVDVKHHLNGTISVNSQQVLKVSKVRADINTLITQGLEIDNFAPVYRYTQLNQIKPDMLKEATQNAKVAASEFAQIAGVRVGGIRSARQGNFSVSDIGQSYTNTQTIEKEVRVVTTITFYLED